MKMNMLAIETKFLQPLDTVSGFGVRPGFYEMNGATKLSCGVNFTIHSQNATSCELLLFHRGEKEPYAVLPFPAHYRIGRVYSMIVFGLDIYDFEYAYRMDGPNDPARGLIFDKEKVLLDPYAKAVTQQSVWGSEPDRQGGYHARVVANDFDWGNMRQPLKPMQELIIYEMHVRGFTNHPSSGVKNPGTFAGIREKIPYLKQLGITAVELMPIFEFDEMMAQREVGGKKLLDYWGYNTVGFFAPNTGYTADVEYNREGNELKELIRELGENGIEVILDVVFNHTAEGNENGPFFSFKGIDNNIYYMLTPDGEYYNFSGCGNTLNCNHPIVRQMIADCLRYWTISYRVDGFRFDLASILGRNEDGSPMNQPPLLRNLAEDPILKDVKLIAEAWDAGGLYQVGSFPAFRRWSEWNGRYRDDVREYLKGGLWAAGAALQRIAGSPDIYDTRIRGKHASVNFLTCHDGFTLYDLYSYNQKHNEANGWGNLDGSDDNRSWNCGAEGETDDPAVMGLRRRLVKNAFAALLCSRGPAMFFAGDEFCNTQYGNNNAYCQDNIISWLDWNRLEEFQEIHDFARFMIHFRAKHPILRRDTKPAVCGLPSVSIHNGEPNRNYTDYNTHLIGIMYAGRNADDTDDDMIFYGMNAYWEPLEMRLPSLPESYHWKLVVNTFCEYQDGADFEAQTQGDQTRVRVPERSTVILLAEHDL